MQGEGPQKESEDLESLNFNQVDQYLEEKVNLQKKTSEMAHSESESENDS